MGNHRAATLLTAVLTVLLTTAATATAGAKGPGGIGEYVALGDSYTAGPFIPLQRLDPLGCFRSTRDYPSLLAGELGPKRFVDASCSGATTTDMTGSQDLPLGSNRPQFDALTADTDLVTLGIGGNDSSVFGTLVDKCVKLAKDDPKGAPCEADQGKRIAAAMPKIQRHVGKVLAGIHQRSPRASVLVVGYPSIVPETGTCPALPLADGDYPWARQVELALNRALRDAVSANGDASYVDTFTPTTGHDVCGSGGAPWINGKDFKLLRALSYHPFETAMRAEATVLYRKLGGVPAQPLHAPYRQHAPTATRHQLERAAG